MATVLHQRLADIAGLHHHALQQVEDNLVMHDRLANDHGLNQPPCALAGQRQPCPLSGQC